jgi:hypothetical protein
MQGGEGVLAPYWNPTDGSRVTIVLQSAKEGSEAALRPDTRAPREPPRSRQAESRCTPESVLATPAAVRLIRWASKTYPEFEPPSWTNPRQDQARKEKHKRHSDARARLNLSDAREIEPAVEELSFDRERAAELIVQRRPQAAATFRRQKRRFLARRPGTTSSTWRSTAGEARPLQRQVSRAPRCEGG